MASLNRPLLPGISMIGLGILFLVLNLTDMRMRDVWPLFVLMPGILFYIMFFLDRANYGLLMPATVLTVSGFMFFYCVFNGWHLMGSIWPLYMVAPGVAFLLMYRFGKKEKGLLIPGFILSGMGFIFLLGATDYPHLWPIVLIIIGVVLIMNSRRKTQES